MVRLVAVGNCVLDTILSVPGFPAEDDKIRASAVAKRRGGNCPNTIDVLQQLCSVNSKTKLTIDLSLAVVLPKRSSSAVQEIHRSFGSGAVLKDSIYRDEHVEPSSSYIIKNLASDSRTIISYNAMPAMRFDEFIKIAERLGKEALWYHFEGRIPNVTLDYIRYLRESVPGVMDNPNVIDNESYHFTSAERPKNLIRCLIARK
ncbi:putative ketohexokinase [Cercophora newfieldiana]|uniref:Ketohexokinase n=1 Tax=Cercophora newfieldiana TaxID=92897 RepID=A0AA40CX84_9PEZI|nr:putative ketohexokinase [Cercophora newfieldiana]